MHFNNIDIKFEGNFKNDIIKVTVEVTNSFIIHGNMKNYPFADINVELICKILPFTYKIKNVTTNVQTKY